MKLEEADIAKTIRNLNLCGKRMPLASNLFDLSPEDKKREAERQLKETVDLWCSLFVGKGIDRETWESATRLALTLQEPLITPSLMNAALNRHAELRQAGVIAKHEDIKSDKGFGVTDPLASRTAKLLSIWTQRKLAEGRDIMPYMPSDAEIDECGSSLDLSVDEIKKQRMLIKIYLNDQKFATSVGAECKYIAYLNDKRDICFRRKNSSQSKNPRPANN